MKCIAFHLRTGKRCDRAVGKSRRALRYRLCATHSKSTVLCLTAGPNCEAIARENWTHVVTPDEHTKIVLTMIAALGEAIAAKNWSFARHMWSRLAPLHPMLIERDPSLVHVAGVLIEHDPLIYERSSATH